MSKETDERETPQELFDELDMEFHFTLDVCATHENTKVKSNYFTKESDGLHNIWAPNICWMNPPYSQIPTWLRKAELSVSHGAIVIAILPMDGSTAWFHRFLWDKSNHQPKKGIQLRFPNKRYKFGSNTNTPKFATLIAVMAPRLQNELDRRDTGTT